MLEMSALESFDDDRLAQLRVVSNTTHAIFWVEELAPFKSEQG